MTAASERPLRQLRQIAPEVDAPCVAIAEEQEQYQTIYAAQVRHPSLPAPLGWNALLLAFRLDDEQRQAIAEGADLYVSLLTFGGPMQPIVVQVGKHSASAVYNVRVLP